MEMIARMLYMTLSKASKKKHSASAMGLAVDPVTLAYYSTTVFAIEDQYTRQGNKVLKIQEQRHLTLSNVCKGPVLHQLPQLANQLRDSCKSS